MNPNFQEKTVPPVMMEACIVGMERINELLLKRYDKIDKAEAAMVAAFPQTRNRINATKLTLVSIGLEICSLIQALKGQDSQAAAKEAATALIHAVGGPELADAIMTRAKEQGII